MVRSVTHAPPAHPALVTHVHGVTYTVPRTSPDDKVHDQILSFHQDGGPIMTQGMVSLCVQAALLRPRTDFLHPLPSNKRTSPFPSSCASEAYAVADATQKSATHRL